jgi:transposase InsO family protein
MPWQETCAMTERLRMLLAVTSREVTMAEACRQAGVSRKTGDKWRARFAATGVSGLAELARAPHHRPQTVVPAIRDAVLVQRAQHPTWGPKKLVAHLRATQPQAPWPAPSTVGDLLKQAGLVVPRRRRPHAPARSQRLAHATAPNTVWCADFKGDFRLGDGSRCYPLTISDAHSRFLLRCQALPATDSSRVQPLFAATFREYGLPDVLRTDNGPPFASVGLAGLTALSVWWIKLGITPERIRPGKPSENGRHERMHRTLKAEACAPPAATLRAQQAACDRFRQEYNAVRPHEALGQRPPASLYTPAPRSFPHRLPALSYPAADAVRWVRPNGAIRWHQAELYLTPTLSGEPVGLSQVGDGRWQVAFGPLVLGTFHERTPILQPCRPSRRRAARTPGATP